MKTRAFGRTGVRIGEVGLGTWQLGTDWGEVTDEEALATLRAAHAAGVDFFDTADIYGAGRSETLVGRFLRETHAKVFVATKLGRGPDPGWPGNFTREAVRRHTEASLRRLGVEALDLTQFHCVPLDVLRRGELFGWMNELQTEGKIRAFGASVETMEEALWCVQQEGCAALQIIFNIFRQKPVATLFPEARKRGVACVVRLPLASGLLAGKYTKQTVFAPGDHRTYNRDGQSFNVGETFAGLPFERGVELADALKPLAPAGFTLADMALRWCLDFDAVSVIIPGAKRPEQARANARVSELASLSRELHAHLAEFYLREVHGHIRGAY